VVVGDLAAVEHEVHRIADRHCPIVAKKSLAFSLLSLA
jgi:hypothetical protein